MHFRTQNTVKPILFLLRWYWGGKLSSLCYHIHALLSRFWHPCRACSLYKFYGFCVFPRLFSILQRIHFHQILMLSGLLIYPLSYNLSFQAFAERVARLWWWGRGRIGAELSQTMLPFLSKNCAKHCCHCITSTNS